VKFLCYFLRQQIKEYNEAETDDLKTIIARRFFDEDAELFQTEMKRYIQP